MKVLFFVRDLAVGGSQRQLAVTAAGLARRGHDVAVAVLYAGGALETLLHGSGARLLSVGKSSRWHVGAPLARLRQLFLSERPDLVYAFLPTQTTLAALLLPARLETKLVFGLRAGGMQLDRYDVLSALFYRTEAWLSRRADLVIANARAVRADAVTRGLPPDRIAVIPNGIDTETMRPDLAAGHAQRRAWGISADAFVIGCVARLDPMKDHANLLMAAASFARQHGDARFVLVGAGARRLSRRAQDARTLARCRGARGVGGRDRRREGGLQRVRHRHAVVGLRRRISERRRRSHGVRRARGRRPTSATCAPSWAKFGEVVPPRQPDLLCTAWARLRHRLAHDRGLREAARNSIIANYGVDVMVHKTEEILSRLCAGRSLPASSRASLRDRRRLRWRVALPECYRLDDRVG